MTNSNPRRRLSAVCAALGLLLAADIGLGSAEAKTVVVQRTHIYVYTLPKGCVKTTYSGAWSSGNAAPSITSPMRAATSAFTSGSVGGSRRPHPLANCATSSWLSPG